MKSLLHSSVRSLVRPVQSLNSPFPPYTEVELRRVISALCRARKEEFMDWTTRMVTPWCAPYSAIPVVFPGANPAACSGVKQTLSLVYSLVLSFPRSSIPPSV